MLDVKLFLHYLGFGLVWFLLIGSIVAIANPVLVSVQMSASAAAMVWINTRLVLMFVVLWLSFKPADEVEDILGGLGKIMLMMLMANLVIVAMLIHSGVIA